MKQILETSKIDTSPNPIKMPFLIQDSLNPLCMKPILWILMIKIPQLIIPIKKTNKINKDTY